MSLRIWIWGILAFPLTILNWLHRVYVYFLPFLGRGRALDTLWRDLGDAETFEEWEKAGLALDHHYNIDYWRRDDKSKDYAWQLISERLGAFALALEQGNIQALVNLLQSGLVRNLGNITVPKLYNVSFAGTKYLIENYILQVCEVISDLAALPPPVLASPGGAIGGGPVPASAVSGLHSLELARAVIEGRCKLRPPGPKKVLFNNLRQSFGQTSLVLQGGSIFGLCHLGVARALFLRGLLPRVITGTGTGALVAALVGIHPDDELPGVLSGDKINLEAFGARAGDGGAPAVVSFRTRLATLRRRIARFWAEGYFLDVRVLEQLVRDNAGDLTFEEAFQRTGRVLNITVVAGGEGEVPSVLNYVTAPNVLIWSAAVASNASDAAWYGRQKTHILCKNGRGETSLWPLADSVHFRHWSHGGSTPNGARHPPLQRVAQLFNVNHFVVSQSRPYLVPFLRPSMRPPDMRGAAATALARFRHYVVARAGHGLRHRLQQLAALGSLPGPLRRLLLDEALPGAPHHLLLVPQVPWGDYGRLLDAPTPTSLRYWIRKGEKSVWPAVAALKIRCSVELAIRDAVEAHHLSEAERRKRSALGLAKMRGR